MNPLVMLLIQQNLNLFITRNYFDTIEGTPICWTPDREAIVINRGISQPLEFCTVFKHEQGPSIRLPCASGWEPYFGVQLNGNREYHGKIEVTSANVDPARVYFTMVPHDDDVKVIITRRKSSRMKHKQKPSGSMKKCKNKRKGLRS